MRLFNNSCTVHKSPTVHISINLQNMLNWWIYCRAILRCNREDPCVWTKEQYKTCHHHLIIDLGTNIMMQLRILSHDVIAQNHVLLKCIHVIHNASTHISAGKAELINILSGYWHESVCTLNKGSSWFPAIYWVFLLLMFQKFIASQNMWV